VQDARSIENKDSAKGPALSKEAQKAQAVAALRREEGVLAKQASDIASQVIGGIFSRISQCDYLYPGCILYLL
jgi:hypothetical protein